MLWLVSYRSLRFAAAIALGGKLFDSEPLWLGVHPVLMEGRDEQNSPTRGT